VNPVRLAALEYELPGSPVDDGRLAAELGVTQATVEGFTRGRTRHFADDGVGPADLAAPAALRALEQQGLSGDDLDLILFATNTPDITFPGSGCFLQRMLDCGTVGCMDIRSQCTGFVVALDVARRFVATGVYRRVLVAAGEVPSHQNRFDGVDPALTCLTADGAAVVLVEAAADEAADGVILATAAETDGTRCREFWCEYPASRHVERTGVARGQRLMHWMVEQGKVYPTIDREAVARTAREHVPAVLERALGEAGLDGVDACLIAHVDPDVEVELAGLVAGRCGRVVHPDLLYSYSASLPVALARALAAGDVAGGETVALLTAGSGATWGAVLLKV